MIRDYKNKKADRWYEALTEHPEQIPFSFIYGGTKYQGFSESVFSLKNKAVEDKTPETHSGIQTTVYTYEFADELEIELRITHYYSHGVTEWTAYFTNMGEHNSAILENPETAIFFSGCNPVLKGIYGDKKKHYEPYCYNLADEDVHFVSDTGRATHVNFPYFNLEYGDVGVMLVIGWAGTWSADFEKTEDGVYYKARSVNNLRTYLKPGEKIRTALFVTAPYTMRDENYATNYWRSWYMEHNLPKGIEPFSTCCLASDTGLPNSDGSISERYDTWKPSLMKMMEEDSKVNFRWFDAGWYIAPDGTSPTPFVKEHDWWATVGTWVLDENKWPDNTFRESVEFGHENGIRTLMWFEPERVTDPENLEKNFGYKAEWAIAREGVRGISNNIGDDECRKYTTERICKVLRENKVDMYREDNNIEPAGLWAYLDEKEGSNRQGISECKFILGHYQMWDDIIACTLSYGGCGFVDSCAAGGGRNDLESMRRGVPLLRSDSDRTTIAIRLSMTTTLNKWLPFCGANTKEKATELAPTGDRDKYIWRASYLAVLNVDSQFVQDPDQDFEMLRFGLKEWKKVNPYILKEFYVLTPWHRREDTTGCTAFSYFDAEEQKGLILAFRQEECTERTCTVTLPYVKPGMVCTVTDEDSGEQIHITGEEMQKNGLTLAFAEPRTARLLWVHVQEG